MKVENVVTSLEHASLKLRKASRSLDLEIEYLKGTGSNPGDYLPEDLQDTLTGIEGVIESAASLLGEVADNLLEQSETEAKSDAEGQPKG